MESSTKEFSRLQEKLEQGHRRDLEEKEETLKAREDSLKGGFVLNDTVTQLHVEWKGSAGYVCTYVCTSPSTSCAVCNGHTVLVL